MLAILHSDSTTDTTNTTGKSNATTAFLLQDASAEGSTVTTGARSALVTTENL